MFSQLPCGRGPHQIKISPYDPEKHVWIIDDQLHMIYRFTYDGQLEMSKGELGVRGRGPNTFDRPTDIAWLPDGTYFITDGYGGTRVAKFGPNDEFIKDWGQAPKDPANPGPNEFNTVHSIAISADQRLFVVDRGHQRMQVFDTDGNFLDLWPLRSPHWPASTTAFVVNHFIDDKGFIWAGDGQTFRVLKFDLDGNFLYSWGAGGPQPGRLGCSHGITTDQLGNLYLADCFAGRVQKFEPLPGADPDKIAGQILRTWDTWSALIAAVELAAPISGGRMQTRRAHSGLARRRRRERRAAALAARRRRRRYSARGHRSRHPAPLVQRPRRPSRRRAGDAAPRPPLCRPHVQRRRHGARRARSARA